MEHLFCTPSLANLRCVGSDRRGCRGAASRRRKPSNERNRQQHHPRLADDLAEQEIERTEGEPQEHDGNRRPVPPRPDATTAMRSPAPRRSRGIGPRDRPNSESRNAVAEAMTSAGGASNAESAAPARNGERGPPRHRAGAERGSRSTSGNAGHGHARGAPSAPGATGNEAKVPAAGTP